MWQSCDAVGAAAQRRQAGVAAATAAPARATVRRRTDAARARPYAEYFLEALTMKQLDDPNRAVGQAPAPGLPAGVAPGRRSGDGTP
jgi:hypothetical protein